ncbi:MAG: molybdate ABC transporter substrate-binding protein [Bacteroidota bacterium]
MSRASLHFSFLLLASYLLVSCSQPSPRILTIAAAANVQFALDSLVRVFEEESGADCEIIVSSSGKLTAQIAKGAPYDIFLSADMKYPQSLYESGHVKSPPPVYAQGSLVVWSMREEDSTSLIDKLNSETIQTIAMANPKTAPYGIAAKEVLEAMELLQVLKPKLTYGESIAQTNHFISSGAADFGFTAKSVVVSPQMREKGTWEEVDVDLYTAIDQGMAIVNHDGYELPEAQQFFDFMLSAKAQAILKHFGYKIPA